MYSAQHAAPARPHRVPGVEAVGGEQRRGRDRPENGRRGGPATGRLTDVAKMNQRLVQVSPSQGQTRRKTLLLRTHQQTQRGGDNPLQNIHISVPWHKGIRDRPSIIFVCLFGVTYHKLESSFFCCLLFSGNTFRIAPTVNLRHRWGKRPRKGARSRTEPARNL